MRVGRPNGWTMAAFGGAAAWLAWRDYRSNYGYDFHDKTVLITGGSRGLGLVMARQFAAERARLAICARDADELDRAAERNNEFSPREALAGEPQRPTA
jgi:hypothetical protein